MSRTTILGYTIEDDGGKIVITLSGSMAQTVFQSMARSVNKDLDSHSTLFLSPFGVLGSRAVSLVPSSFEDGQQIETQKPNLKEIFGQGFDQDCQSFDEQLSVYRQMLTPQSETSDLGAAESPEHEVLEEIRQSQDKKRATLRSKKTKKQ